MDENAAGPTQVGADTEVTAEFDEPEWARFVDAEPGSTPAHLIEWRKLISDVFGYQAIYRVARRDGKICAALPAFLVRSILLGPHIVSVPFLNSGGICASDDDGRSALAGEANSLVRQYRAKHLEMRCAYPPPDGVSARQHKVRIVLDLPGSADEMWTSLRSEIRNRTRRALNAGLTVEFSSPEIDGFHRVFAENMHELGVPSHPKRFFEVVLERLGGRAELVVVRHGVEVVGGAVLVKFRDTVEAPWISCSRLHFELCPNNILYWEIIRRACDEGFRTFDFGRSSPDTGPAIFKMRWGARDEQLYWHYVLPDGESMPEETSSANRRFHQASEIWKRVPSALAGYLGPKLIRHLPG